MSNISQWSTTAASNNSASPNGWPESMAPSGVNDSARENMAALAKFYAGIKGSLATTGSANAYVLSTGSSHAALADIGPLIVKPNFVNTGAATINVDTIGVKAIQNRGAALVGGELTEDETFILVYNSDNDAFQAFGISNVSTSAVAAYTKAQYFTPVSVTSTSNAVAINMVTDQECKHTLTENTTVSAPSNAAEGMKFRILVTQHASSAKTLAWNGVFQGTIPTMTTSTGDAMIFYFDCYDGTNFIFSGATDAFTPA